MRYFNIIILVTVFLFGSKSTFSQGKDGSYGRKKGDWYGDRWRGTPLYKWQGFYKRTGLHFTGGATYTLTRTAPREESIRTTSGDTSFNQSAMPKGRLGYYAKVGALHIFKFKRKIFQYIDYGIGVKHFAGQENYNSEMSVDRGGTTEVTDLSGTGKFDLGYAFLDFNANNIIQITPNNWIQNSLGFNIDYRIYGGGAYEGIPALGTQDFQEDFKADIHYKLGLGIKLVNGMYLIPAVETPVFTAYHWRGGEPQIHWFTSKYQPLTVSLTFAFLFRKDPADCPPVFSPGDKNRSKKYQKSGG